ncbi:MAG: cytochrome b N-terminal domain-containing protein [Planctomycetota bacterium]
MSNRKRWFEKIKETRLFQSIFRHPYPMDKQSRIRTVLNNFFLHLHPAKVPADSLKLRKTWGMGGLTFFFFIILFITGILLAFYYRPTPEHANEDIRDIIFVVPFGAFIRNMHRWSSYGMLICMYLHGLRIFLTGSYKQPREFNWVIGIILLVITHFICFTGYLLTWDQAGYWAFTVGSDMAKSAPLLGSDGPFSNYFGVTPANDLRSLLIGGTELNQPASLLRSYVLHCFILPFFFVILMCVHFWRVRKDNKLDSPVTEQNENE